jgi:signal transduction histidine kinase
MNRRLYFQLYLAFLGLALVAVVAAALAFRVVEGFGGPPSRASLAAVRYLVRNALPPPTSPAFRQRLTAIATEMALDLAIWDEAGRPLFEAAERPFPAPRRLNQGWSHDWRHGLSLVVALPGGRYLGMRPRDRERSHGGGLFVAMGVVAAALAAVAYPVARRITRRLERLEEGARRWGAGELTHRVSIEGRDEIAALAERFNAAAAQIDELLAQQRQMLANASHELRSPLARLAMALELIADIDDPDKRRRRAEDARRDIVELDALVEQLLLIGRTQAGAPRRPPAEVDLRALVSDEAERARAAAPGAQIAFRAEGEAKLAGDAAMLRHLARNLIENAIRHGAGTPIDVSIEPRPEGLCLAVEDRGPGVPEAERERIFAPFYRVAGAAGGAGRGAGVGLALVRHVARYHGGEARHAPRPGGGSRFEVTLPPHERGRDS